MKTRLVQIPDEEVRLLVQRIKDAIVAAGYGGRGGMSRLARDIGVSRQRLHSWTKGAVPQEEEVMRRAEKLLGRVWS
jgi:hypothetical protein